MPDAVWWAVIAASAAAYLITAWMWVAFVGRAPTDAPWVYAAWSAFWCASASLYLQWDRPRSPDGPWSLPDWVLRPAIVTQPWFQTELTWAAVLIGGAVVLMVRHGMVRPRPA